MKKKIFLNFLAGFLDLLLIFGTIFLINYFLMKNINILNTTKGIKTYSLINSTVLLFYLGFVPYFFDYKTISEKILGISPRINKEIINEKLENTKKINFFNNSVNLTIEKFVYIFTYRFFNFILDLLLINFVLGVFNTIKSKLKLKPKENKNDK